MRPVTPTLSVAFLFALVAGCGAGNVSPSGLSSQPISVVPDWMHRFAMTAAPPQPMVFDARPKAGIYATEFYGTHVFGYRNPDTHDKRSICKVPAESVNGVGVDGAGNLIVPNGYPAQISVYRGPGLCGKLIGTVADPYGEASDAASSDAATKTIVVANIETSRADEVGNIAVCTLSKGCTRKLKSRNIRYHGGGVALAKNGDCWMASENDPSLSAAALTYFKRCKGHGKAARGWKNAYYGGLIIDKKGRILSIDFNTPALWIYKGCDPVCQVVGGPFPLQGASFYGNLNAKGDELALGDIQYGQVDVYRYAHKALRYKYSFNNGLNQSYDVEAAGFAPTL